MNMAWSMLRGAGCLLVLAVVYIVMVPAVLLCASLGLLNPPDPRRL
jgi:hypothetical protein